MSNPIEDLACQALEEKQTRIKELETLVASLRQQLKTARETIDNYQKRAVSRRRDEYDYLDYEDDRDR